MAVVSTLFNHLRRQLPGGTPETTQRPLLTKTEILDLLYRVQDLHLPADHFRDVAHSMFGDAQSIYRGYGMNYEESRPYQAGDELRFMNWRLTARTGEPYMKVFREERRPGVFILVDRRAAMRFGSRVRLKVTQAARAAAVAAFAAQQQNIPVGGVILEKDCHWLAEASGPTGAMHLVREASTPCPPLLTQVTEPALGHILRLLRALLTCGSRVYLISDFQDLVDNDRPALLQLSTDHQVYAIHISDIAEQQLPRLGKLRFIAPASFDTNTVGLTINTSDGKTRQGFEQTAQQQLQARQHLFTSLGIPYQRITTDSDSIEQQVPLP
jgi:uncharacterized protein (DUF58 family)